MYNIGVIGDQDSVQGFAALGPDVFYTTDPFEAAETLKSLAKKEYAIVFLTERLAAGMEELLDVYAKRTTPAVILIPDSGGSLGIALKNVSKTVERAVGADILP